MENQRASPFEKYFKSNCKKNWTRSFFGSFPRIFDPVIFWSIIDWNFRKCSEKARNRTFSSQKYFRPNWEIKSEKWSFLKSFQGSCSERFQNLSFLNLRKHSRSSSWTRFWFLSIFEKQAQIIQTKLHQHLKLSVVVIRNWKLVNELLIFSTWFRWKLLFDEIYLLSCYFSLLSFSPYL